MRQSIKRIFFFEILYKTGMLMFILPVLRLAFLKEWSVPGELTNLLIFNGEASVTGILTLLFLLLLTLYLALFELTVLILIPWNELSGRKLGFIDLLDQALQRSGELFTPKNAGLILLLLIYLGSQATWILSYPGSLITSILGRSFFSICEPYPVLLFGLKTGSAVCSILLFLGLFVPYLIILEDYPLRTCIGINRALLTKFFRNEPGMSRRIMLCFLTGVFFQALFSLDPPISDSAVSFSVMRYMLRSSYYGWDLLYRIAYSVVQILLSAVYLYDTEMAYHSLTVRVSRGEHHPYRHSSQNLSTFGRSPQFLPVPLLRSVKKIGQLKGIALFCFFSLLILIPALSVEIPLLERPLVIGHRGSAHGVENTLTAFFNGYEEGADVGELDVHLLKDGTLLAVHDNDLERLGGGEKLVEEMDLKQAKRILLTQKKNYAYSNTLGEIIDYAKNLRAYNLLIELKPENGNEAQLVERVIEEVEKRNFSERAMFMSFSTDCIGILKQKRPDWWTGYLGYGIGENLKESTWNYGFDFLALSRHDISYPLIAQARARSIPVYVWTVKDPQEARRLYSIGVEGIITNYPERIVPVRDELLKEGIRYVYPKRDSLSRKHTEG